MIQEDIDGDDFTVATDGESAIQFTVSLNPSVPNCHVLYTDAFDVNSSPDVAHVTTGC